MEAVIMVFVTGKDKWNRRSRSIYCTSALSIEENNKVSLWSGARLKHMRGDITFEPQYEMIKLKPKNEADRQQRDNFPHKKLFYLLIPTFISGAWMNPPEGQEDVSVNVKPFIFSISVASNTISDTESPHLSSVCFYRYSTGSAGGSFHTETPYRTRQFDYL